MVLVTEETQVLSEDTVVLETGDMAVLVTEGIIVLVAEYFGVLVAVTAVDNTGGIPPCWVTFKIL